jgi:hypothetical protein
MSNCSLIDTVLIKRVRHLRSVAFPENYRTKNLNAFAAYSGPQTIPFIGVGAFVYDRFRRPILLLAWNFTILCLY